MKDFERKRRERDVERKKQKGQTDREREQKRHTDSVNNRPRRIR